MTKNWAEKRSEKGFSKGHYSEKETVTYKVVKGFSFRRMVAAFSPLWCSAIKVPKDAES